MPAKIPHKPAPIIITLILFIFLLFLIFSTCKSLKTFPFKDNSSFIIGTYSSGTFSPTPTLINSFKKLSLKFGKILFLLLFLIIYLVNSFLIVLAISSGTFTE